jgi:hypothetical protein
MLRMIYRADCILPAKEERVDARRMIELLSPRRRLEWLNWCCEQLSADGVVYVIDNNDGTSPNQVLADCLTLFWGRDPLLFRAAGERLSLMLRRIV